MSIYVYKNGIIPFCSAEDYANLNEVLFRVTADTIEELEYIGEVLKDDLFAIPAKKCIQWKLAYKDMLKP